MSSNSLTDCSQLTLPVLKQIAIKTKLIVRKTTKFSANGFLHSVVCHTLHLATTQDKMISRGRLSFEKLYDQLAIFLVMALRLDDLHDFSPDPRHIVRDLRKRISLITVGIAALS